MRRIAVALTTASMTLVGCQQEDAAPAANISDSSDRAGECSRIKSATAHGHISMRAAFVATKDGADYGGGVIDALIRQKGYRFVGVEKVGPSCWAYAEANGTEWGKPFHLKWRCPIQAVAAGRPTPEEDAVELVDDRLCEFDKALGAPAVQSIEMEMMRV